MGARLPFGRLAPVRLVRSFLPRRWRRALPGPAEAAHLLDWASSRRLPCRHAFITNRVEPLALTERDHPRPAQIEPAPRAPNEGSAPNHAPSGSFPANAAWPLISSLAHTLARSIVQLGLGASGPVVVQTIRRRYPTLPGPISQSAPRLTPHPPARRPWREDLTHALTRPPAIPLL